MVVNEYATALKQGRKGYQTALSKGQYPYLPVLDDILSYTELAVQVSLGLIDIPLEKIVGTKTAGRTNSFAVNFMPLLSERSEFGAKWSALYDHQVGEGIRDPIVVYEFMNRFYVQEGNKRVSVMKYLGAYSIPGMVTRLIPKKTEELDNRLYYEFLDFYEVSQSYDIYFTKEGGYKKLLKLMGKKPDEQWTSDDRMLFHSVIGRFADAFYMAHKERKVELTVSDAFLLYVEIYGYDQVKKETEQKMYKALLKMWEEIRLADKGSQVELVENPKEEKSSKASLLNRLIPVGTVTPEMLKIAFIYPKTAETSSWTYAHELGRLYLEDSYGGKLKTMAIDRADTDGEIENAIELAIASGCNVVFTIAIQMVNQSVRAAIRHPEVKIYNCSVKMSYSSIATYYGRMYESKFLLGAIAAAMARTDRLGYVADYPIYGAVANVNAFALGARMINPWVKIHLKWSGTKGEAAEEKLKQEGIVFISGADMITPEHASREYGLYLKKEDGSLENLATPIWHWGKFYERIIKSICNGSDENTQKGKKAVNYWWGISADVVDVICSNTMPYETKRLIEFLKWSIRSGSFQPFGGMILSQNGTVRCKEGESLSAEDIVTMDWLVENVVGQIPGPEDLTEEAQALVQLQGVKGDETDTEK